MITGPFDLLAAAARGRDARPCSRPAPAPARPTRSPRWSPATSPRARRVLDDMLLITFSRAASQELRERVRDQLVAAAEALDDPSSVDPDDDAALPPGHGHRRASVDEKRLRLRDALAGFDAATIATTHQFCQLVLRSLGVAGDTDAGVTLVENLDELVGEIVDDLYLQRFGDVKDTPALTRAQALELAHEVVRNPRTRLTPIDPPAETTAGVRRAFADDVLRELERRKRLLGILGFDDLLGRLAVALEADDAPARDRMRRRWRIVMVDEFQDTDPVQWEVIERAFVGQVTLVLIGDPKQAIYAFRGGDVVTYLRARDQADALLALDTNYRSDAPLVRAAAPGARGCRPRPRRHRGARRGRPPHHSSARRRAAQRPVPAAGGLPGLVRDRRHPHHPDGRPAAVHRGRPRGRRQAAARLGCDLRRPRGPRPGRRRHRREPPRRSGLPRRARGGRGPRRLHRRHRRLRLAGRGRLAVPARGVRAAGP